MTNVPTPGRIVEYTLTTQDADSINARRAHAEEQRIKVGDYQDGVMVHVGNQAEAGQVLPMVIVRAWGDQETSAVNGQVILDGNDVLWKTSVSVGQGEGRFAWPVRR